MATLETRYLPADRLRALAIGESLPTTAYGSALFADISGFTPITERLRHTLGARRGAETLALHLNRVYDALIAQVEQHGGTIISFAGDAVTCWFPGDDAPLLAVACAFALLDIMLSVEQIPLPNGATASIGLKVSIATGTVRRFIAGDPEVQRIDVLAGATVARMAAGEAEAERGDVVVDSATLSRLGHAAHVRATRERDGERFAVLERLSVSPALLPAPQSELDLDDATLRPWLVPAVAAHFEAGLGEYLTELRPAVAVFIRFSGIDYDNDPEAAGKLDRFIRLAQALVERYEGNVLQVTIGDKGSYLYATFGAPLAHEDDVARALRAALELRAAAALLDYLAPVQIGVSQGIMRTGAYGGETRRTYGVLGDEVNLAARLMMRAAPGEILISEMLVGARLDSFVLEALPPAQIKGKASPLRIFRLVEQREQSFEARFYTTPLIGRLDELRALKAALQPIFEGRHAGVIMLNGEPGMGKSRLAAELRQRLQAEAPVSWVTGQADSMSRAPLSVFAYFLRPYFGQRRGQDPGANLAVFDAAFTSLLGLADEANRADLMVYRSFLAGVVGLVIPASPYEAADAKLRIDNGIAALKAWVRAESRRQPLIVHLEDAQWLDADSSRAVQQLTYNMEAVPVALLLTSRYNDDGSPNSIPNIYAVPVHTFDLNQLSDEGVRALTEAIIGTPLSDRLVRFVYERAEGNPFFTEQLVLDLSEREALIKTEGVWDLRPGAAAEVPSGVNAVLIARLDRLSAHVKAVVQTAAVLGREFDVQILSQMLREGERAYIRLAEEEAIWVALDALRYLFRHALLRDAAYQMQVQERLKALHRLAAETIERLYSSDTLWQDVLLEHWQGAGVADKIIAYTAPVCERLIEVTADYSRAEHLLQQALSLGDTPLRAVFLRLHGDTARLRGQYEEAIAYYQTCLNAVGEQAGERIQALNGLGQTFMIQGDNAQATAVFERTLALAREHQDQALLANVFLSLGTLASRQGENDLAQTYYAEALRINRALENHGGITDALTSMAIMQSIAGNYALANTYIEESLAIARNMGHRQKMAQAYNVLGTVALEQGDHQAARPYYENSLRIRREIGDRHGVGAVLGNLAILVLRQGDLIEAQAFAEASLEIRRAIGDKRGIANALNCIASIARDRNEFSAAQEHFLEILQLQRAINDRWGMATTLINLGEGAGYIGNFTEAQTYIAEGLALYRQMNQPLGIADALSFQAELAYEQGDAVTARSLYHEALKILREIGEQRCIATSLLSLANLDLREGALEEAENKLDEALTLLRRHSLADLPRAVALLAVVKHRSGQSDEHVYALLCEALLLAQEKKKLLAMFSTWIETASVLFADRRYIVQAELIGQLLKHSLPYRSRLDVQLLLDKLRPHLDPPMLAAALERGKARDLDATSAALLIELGRR